MPRDYLYGITSLLLRQLAEAGRHHFPNTNPDGGLRSLVILHFEGFLLGIDGTCNYRVPGLPDRIGPDFRFSMENVTNVTLGEHDNIHNNWFFDADEDIRSNPGAELAHTARLLSEFGCAIPRELGMSRFVRVVSEDRKSELILSYLEPLASMGFCIADFFAGGRGERAVGELSERLAARSLEVFEVERG